jgi:hypothetical protein
MERSFHPEKDDRPERFFLLPQHSSLPLSKDLTEAIPTPTAVFAVYEQRIVWRRVLRPHGLTR